MPELTSLDLHSVVELPAGLYLDNLSSTADAPLNLKLTSLTTVRGDFHFVNLSTLESFDGLAALALVDGPFGVGALPALQSLKLPQLKKVTARIDVNSNAALSELALGALTSVGSAGGYSIAVSALPELTSLDLHSMVAPRQLEQHRQCTLTLTCTSLGTIRGNLNINACATLESLSGFSALTSVLGSLAITSNASLSTCAAQALATQAQPTGTVSIDNNVPCN